MGMRINYGTLAMMTFVDTHAHLEAVDDLDGVLERAKNVGVGKIVTIGTSMETSKKAVKIADPPSHKVTDASKLWRRSASEGQGNTPVIYATVGIHPKDGKGDIEKFGLFQCINTLKQIVRSSKKVVGVGEAGLDYHLTSDPSTSPSATSSGPSGSGQAKQLTTDKEKDFQRELFREQIKLAAQLKLPLVIHCRNAWEEIFDLLSKHNHYSSSGFGDSRRSQEVSAKNISLNGKFSTNSNNKLWGVFHSWTGD